MRQRRKPRRATLALHYSRCDGRGSAWISSVSADRRGKLDCVMSECRIGVSAAFSRYALMVMLFISDVMYPFACASAKSHANRRALKVE